MNRGPRDLRDLICVSRLTFHVSDDEVFSGDELVSAELDNLSVGSSGSSDSRQSSAVNGKHRRSQKLSPDSGCVTNDSSPSDTVHAGQTSANTDELKLDLSGLKENQKDKSSKKKKRKKKGVHAEPPRHTFPKPPALPPVGRSLSGEADEAFSVTTGSESDSSVSSRLKNSSSNVSACDTTDQSSRTSSVGSTDDVYTPVPAAVKTSVPNRKPGKSAAIASHADTGNYDDMLCYMDATIVSSWLTRANKSVSELAAFIHSGENFVKFSHFWLTDFPDIQKQEIFELEHDILQEELTFAFATGRDQRKISSHDIRTLIGAIFREYPSRILASKFLFLEYLDTLSSDRTQKYKQLLSDVKCSTKNRQYAQWLLATRSFALVSIWSAIINFYRNMLVKRGNSEEVTVKNTETTGTYKNINEKRFDQALQLGYSDVIHYLVISDKVDARAIYSHDRTTIFTAVMHNQPRVLKYLISRVKPPIDINHVSDTGNTALHAAANSGSVKMVAELLNGEQINVNCVNRQCENSTPLHLAVMHGHRAIVELLLQAGADKCCKMGDLTPIDIARDFDQADILAVLEA